jgi:glutamine amidotransferase
MKKIAVIDYGMGNLRSVQKGLEKVGANAFITENPEEILAADGVVLPGVGAFKDCMDNLEAANLIEPIKQVVNKRTPFLGICLGLQLLFEESEEFGIHKGLGILPGRIRRFPANMPDGDSERFLKVPHMGWNSVSIKKECPLLKDVQDGDYFYFVHSYYVDTPDKDIILTETNYGITYTSAVCRDNVYGVQFHPEKSQDIGLTIFKRFGEIL